MKQWPISHNFKYPFSKNKPQPTHDIDGWVEAIKKKAIQNLENEFERLRINWTHKYKIPKYKSFDEYTPEEILLETWEQYFFENPDSLEVKGIFKKVNPKTGYAYYVTNDPVLNQLEEAFGRGETPDLEQIFGEIKGGKDIFREHVFVQEHGKSAGDVIAPRKGLDGVTTNEKGDKITVTGSKIEHDDFSSDAWIKDALEDDPILKDFAQKIGKSDGRL